MLSDRYIIYIYMIMLVATVFFERVNHFGHFLPSRRQAAVDFAAKAAGQDLTLRRLGRGKAKAAELSQKRQERCRGRC